MHRAAPHGFVSTAAHIVSYASIARRSVPDNHELPQATTTFPFP